MTTNLITKTLKVTLAAMTLGMATLPLSSDAFAWGRFGHYRGHVYNGIVLGGGGCIRVINGHRVNTCLQ